MRPKIYFQPRKQFLFRYDRSQLEKLEKLAKQRNSSINRLITELLDGFVAVEMRKGAQA